MASLEGKIVLITEPAPALEDRPQSLLHGKAAGLLVCARRAEPLGELKQTLRAAGATDVRVFELDVQDRSAVEAAIASLPAEWSEIDVLVNNAGLSRGLTKLYEDDPQNWEEMIDTNVKGLLYVTRCVVPGMVARARGHVINLGSTAAYITYANGAVYCASKAAEKAISEGLKIDLMGTPVRVTSVDPGMVETNFSVVRFRGDEVEGREDLSEHHALGAGDVAEAIVWAASRPAHVNIHTVVMTTIDQANSTVFHRRG